MFLERSEFVAAAAALLGVSENAVSQAMADVDRDEDAGIIDHNPCRLGNGGFCGPTSGEWCGANGFTSETVSDGRYRAAV